MLEQEARQAKEHLAEMARTVTKYSALISRKETDIARVTADPDKVTTEKDQTLKQATDLHAQVETTKAQLDAQRQDNVRSVESQVRLQEVLDELRTLMQAKTSEEMRRKEVEKCKEKELIELRSQLSSPNKELTETRKASVEHLNKVKGNLEIALVRMLLSTTSINSLGRTSKSIRPDRKRLTPLYPKQSVPGVCWSCG